MAKKENRFPRPYGVIPYRKRFIIAAEGKKTEPAYFSLFQNDRITLDFAKSKHSSPKYVIKSLKEKKPKKNDEVWIVFDLDQWTQEQLQELLQESQRNKYSLAVSNPKFEYWLLLHFEDGNEINSPKECDERLKRYIPNFDKSHIEIDKLKAGIESAIQRARTKDSPPCQDWPHTNGSTAYRLVEKLIK